VPTLTMALLALMGIGVTGIPLTVAVIMERSGHPGNPEGKVARRGIAGVVSS
jgi:hypothetical protein